MEVQEMINTLESYSQHLRVVWPEMSNILHKAAKMMAALRAGLDPKEDMLF